MADKNVIRRMTDGTCYTGTLGTGPHFSHPTLAKVFDRDSEEQMWATVGRLMYAGYCVEIVDLQEALQAQLGATDGR